MHIEVRLFLLYFLSHDSCLKLGVTERLMWDHILRFKTVFYKNMEPFLIFLLTKLLTPCQMGFHKSLRDTKSHKIS